MRINEILAQTGGLKAMARELGVSEAQAASGAAALAPAIIGGFKKQAQAQPAGAGGLGDLLGKLGGGGLLDNVLSPQPTDVSRGNNVLGSIFGSKDVSRAVTQNASAQTGLDPSVLKKMLPMVAMMVGGYLAKQPQAGAPASPAGGLLGGLLGGRSGGGAGGPGKARGIASLLDGDGDGNPLDDILRMVKK